MSKNIQYDKYISYEDIKNGFIENAQLMTATSSAFILPTEVYFFFLN